MYCVKCGVELSDSEQICPLCGTPTVLPPDERPTEPRPYPMYEEAPERVNPTGLLFVITVLFAMTAILCLLCDYKVNGLYLWSDYVTCALLWGYLVAVLPAWFRHPQLAVHIPCDFLGLALLLFYINHKVGGQWFLSLALPVVACICVLVMVPFFLLRYCRRAYLYIWSGTFLASGLFMLLLEYLINCTFGLQHGFLWSLYPLTAFVMIGLMLLVIALVRPWRESLRRKFFL